MSTAPALDEAQRLLVDHGTWTTESGAYLESDQVTVLIHPVHDDAGTSGADPVDVVVSVRPRPGPQSGATITLEPMGAGTAGRPVSMPLNRRGQAVFRRLPAGEWRARLVPAAQEGGVATEPSAAEVVPLRRIPRRLAAAAGGERRQIRDSWSSADGRLLTEVVETDEAHLVVAISSSASPATTAMVRIRWALTVTETTGQTATLVLPLAASEDGTEMTVKYDLGPVDQAEAVDVGPAVWADPSELTVELVLQAFELPLYGSARRAWEQLAAAGVCPTAVQAALRSVLGR